MIQWHMLGSGAVMRIHDAICLIHWWKYSLISLVQASAASQLLVVPLVLLKHKIHKATNVHERVQSSSLAWSVLQQNAALHWVI